MDEADLALPEGNGDVLTSAWQELEGDEDEDEDDVDVLYEFGEENDDDALPSGACLLRGILPPYLSHFLMLLLFTHLLHNIIP